MEVSMSVFPQSAGGCSEVSLVRVTAKGFAAAIVFWCAFYAGSGVAAQAPPIPFGTVGSYAPSDFYVLDVTTDHRGNVYAVDWFHRDVSRYSPGGVLQLEINDPVVHSVKPVMPRRVAVDSQMRMYVTYPERSRDIVRVFSRTGERLYDWDLTGIGPGGIQFVPPNRLYVAMTRLGMIVVYDTERNELFRFGSPGSGLGQFSHPQDVAVAPDGSIFVADDGNGRIQKFDSEGRFLWARGRAGTVPGQFRHPVAVSVDSAGDVFVSDRRNFRVQKFDASGNLVAIWGGKGSNDGQFNEHHGLEVGPDDTVWVAGYHGNDIQRFGNDGEFLERWQGHISGPGEFSFVGGIAVDDGNLFALDVYNQRGQVFNALTGEFLHEFGERGSHEATVFNFPKAVACGPDGDLYVSDDDYVRRIRQDGTFVMRYPRLAGSRPGSHGLVVSGDGQLFQSDLGNARVIKTDTETGETLAYWGQFGQAPGDFNRPFGTALGPDGTLYVADSSNRRVQMFDQNGTFIDQWGVFGADPSRAIAPQGLAADYEAGVLYIGTSDGVVATDFQGSRLYSWDYSGTGSGAIASVGQIGTGASLQIAVDEQGVVYVTDPGHGRIHRYIHPREVSLRGRPSYGQGLNEGAFLWKDSFDGSYHLRIVADGGRSYEVAVLSDRPIRDAAAYNLDAGDTWAASDFGFSLALPNGFGLSSEKGADFSLEPNTRALISLRVNGEAAPGRLRVGSRGLVVAPEGWIMSVEDLPARPGVTAGADADLFLGASESSPRAIQARWKSTGERHRADFMLLSSEPLEQVTPESLDANDQISQTVNAVSIASRLSRGWDGVSVEIAPQATVGLVYKRDGVMVPNRVNPEGPFLGFPDAFALPQATPYGAPEFRPEQDAGLYLWKDGDDGAWRLRAAGGGSPSRYRGSILADMAPLEVRRHELESGDILDTTDPTRIVFDLASSSWPDGFDFKYPPGAVVYLALEDDSAGGAASVMLGRDKWPVASLPLELSGW